MAKGKVLRIRVSAKLQNRIDQEADNRGMNRSAFIRYCIEKELPNSKEEELIIMLREEMIEELTGEIVTVGGEWMEENDPEMLDWITSNRYWGRGYKKAPSREKAYVRLEFDEGGVRYIAIATAADEVDVDQSLNNQPPWGEDTWEDWTVEDIKKYYMLVKNKGEKYYE